MKGLMFNLLDNMARQSDCSDEAWELVIEFASAERLIVGRRAPGAHELDTSAINTFETPAQAMFNCLTRESPPWEEDEWHSLDSDWRDTDSPDPFPGLGYSTYDGFPKDMAGLGMNAFSSLEYSLDQLDELDNDEVDDEFSPFDLMFPLSDPPEG